MLLSSASAGSGVGGVIDRAIIGVRSERSGGAGDIAAGAIACGAAVLRLAAFSVFCCGYRRDEAGFGAASTNVAPPRESASSLTSNDHSPQTGGSRTAIA